MSHTEKLAVLKDVFGNCFKSGNEFLFQCPNPQCTQNKKKLSINIDKNVFKCWICDLKGNSIRRLVRKFGSFLQKQAWNTLDSYREIADLTSLFDETLVQEKPVTISLPDTFISLANSKLPISAFKPQRYLKERGLTKSDILKWKIGYSSNGEYQNRIIIPSFNKDGDVNYFVARTYSDNWITYTNPNISKDLVFNELYIDWEGDVTLVEGVFDAIKAENAIPLLGSSLRENSKLFKEIIKHDTPLFIALDPDAEKKSLELIKMFLLYDIEVKKIDISGYKDVGEMTSDIFKERKKNATVVGQDSILELLLRA